MSWKCLRYILIDRLFTLVGHDNAVWEMVWHDTMMFLQPTWRNWYSHVSQTLIGDSYGSVSCVWYLARLLHIQPRLSLVCLQYSPYIVWITILAHKGKGKGMVLYSAVSSPLDRSKRFTLSSPGRPVHSDTVLGFSWKHSSHAAIAQRLFTHIPPLSIARYSFIQLSRLRRREVKENAQTSKR